MMITEANKEPLHPNNLALLLQFVESLKKMYILNR
jgi:hypothetical protein